MDIIGNTVTTNKSPEELFKFLTKLENYEQLMPESTQKFEVDGDSFIFGLKGMPEIRLVMKEKTEFSNVTLGAASSKLPFTLTSEISKLSENQSNIILKFNGDFNPMMAMMVKKPLTKFIETLTKNISAL
ncbi:SRPBCC family protein [Tenacibaculum sp. C7A-26P2]|uniref:SRPBCC family protein n=1 Tax=Tenacibaculum sp. C7A-26P2 TaxID=3447504 RepID=UPI003F85C618